MDKDYFIFYILSIIFLNGFLIWRNLEPLNYILAILCGTAINIMALLHFHLFQRSKP